MATDATGTPTSLGIPKLSTSVDKPTGVGINAMMDAIDALITARTVAIPSGLIVSYGGLTAPAGYYLCDGTAYSTTSEAPLFAAISTAYGTGGAGTFKVPDLRGRAIFGAGAGAGLTSRSLGQIGGEETHLLTQTELPVTTLAPGNAGTNFVVSTVGVGVIFVNNLGSGTGVPGLSTAGTFGAASTTQSFGGGAVHNNMPPFGVCNYIIKR